MVKCEDLTANNYFSCNDQDYKILNIDWLAGDFPK